MRSNFKPGTLHAPLPAVMATVGDMENSNIITVAWTGILSSDPARTYISVRPSRYSHKLLCETGEFVINLTTEALAYATDYAGIYTGAKVDKFEKLGLTKVKSAEVSAPTIKESPLALECRVFDVLHFGTHDVFMADIVNVSCDDSILDKSGRICFDKAGLMAYAHGEYYSLGEKIGKFGFSAARTQDAKRYVERSKRKLEAKRTKVSDVSVKKTDKSHPVSNKSNNGKGGQKREKPTKR
jgi:flavin reductase (DIM6/NTAB) family NADH-FMN oxidoreductase RutF